MLSFEYLTYSRFARFTKTALAISLLLTYAVPTQAQVRKDQCDAYIELLKETPPSDSKPGSVLFFHRCVSDAASTSTDTLVNLTNTRPDDAVDVHLFCIEAVTGAVEDSYLTLFPNQTASFTMSGMDPGTEGYMVAVATCDGMPMGFNYLIGEAIITEGGAREAVLPALAVGSRVNGQLPLNADQTATLKFDGVQFDRLPQTVAVPSFGNQLAQDSRVALYSPRQDFTGSNEAITKIRAVIYNDSTNSCSVDFLAHYYRQMSVGELRINGGMNAFVQAGHTGWMKFTTTTGDRPMLGAVFHSGTRFSGGRNLSIVALLPEFTITVPTEPPIETN